MALAKMTALAQHLIAQNIFAVENFDYWMENGSSEYANKKVAKGVVIGRFQYEAVFSVERFSNDADIFLALINVWLIDNDSNRDDLNLDMPSVDVTPLDDHTTDVEVKIIFSEDITLQLDDNGPVLYSGQRWGIAPLVISDVNKIGVGDTPERPTDSPYERP